MESKKFIILFVTYFGIGLLVNIISVSFPILYIDIGLTPAEIGSLTSILYLGAIFQPVIGYLCDITGKKVKVLQSLFILLTIVMFLMTIFQEFYYYIVLVFLISVFRRPVLGILDEITISYAKENNLNYGKYRSGASWGFALGMFFLLPLYKFGVSDAILFGAMIISILVAILLQNVNSFITVVDPKKAKKYKNDEYKKDFWEKIISLKFFRYLLVYLLVIGSLTLKTSYQNILLSDIRSSAFIAALINFISVAPEMYLMPRSEKLFGKLSYKKMMTIVSILVFIHIFILSIASSPAIIISTVWLHGVVSAINLPVFHKFLKEHLGENVSSTGFLLNLMTLSLGIVFINYFIITPIYVEFGIQQAFFTLSIISLVGLIPIHIMKD